MRPELRESSHTNSFCAVRLEKIALALVLAWTGCAGPGPRLFPVAPLSSQTHPDGTIDQLYDLDADGRADYEEHLDATGVVIRLSYDSRGNGQFDERVELASIDPRQCRQLILLLDSVPYSMVRDLWDQGRFRLFPRPSRTISPFPAMTDLSFSELFDVSPAPGIESEYFNGRRLTSGYSTYAQSGNIHWQQHVDYHLSQLAHSSAYLHPLPWLDHELREVQDAFLGRTDRMFIGYAVGTSALGIKWGRNGQETALIHVDRLCHWLLHATKGRARITLLSDHGRNLVPSRRIPLPEMLGRFGYHVADQINRPDDVVVPEFGLVTCAAIHTKSPARVARDATGIEGVELAAYCDEQDRIIVLSRDGRATITHRDNRFAYRPDLADPLQLVPVVALLRHDGKLDAEGFVDDSALFEATVSHVYPDAVQRLWRAFHGLIEHTPDVLISIQDGWHCGSPLMSKVVAVAASHGNLGQTGSCGFAMSMAGGLPTVMRMVDLRLALQRLGVDLAGAGTTQARTINTGRVRSNDGHRVAVNTAN